MAIIENELEKENEKIKDQLIQCLIYTSVGIQLVFFGICYFSINQFWTVLTAQIMFIGINILAGIFIILLSEICEPIIISSKNHLKLRKIEEIRSYLSFLNNIFSKPSTFIGLFFVIFSITAYCSGNFAINKALKSKYGNDILQCYLLTSDYAKIRKIGINKGEVLNQINKAKKDTIGFAVITHINMSERFEIYHGKGRKIKRLIFQYISKRDSLAKFQVTLQNFNNEVINNSQLIVKQLEKMGKEMDKINNPQIDSLKDNLNIFFDKFYSNPENKKG